MQQSRPFRRKSRLRSVYNITTLSLIALRDHGPKTTPGHIYATLGANLRSSLHCALRTLICPDENIKNLKQQLPHISINKERNLSIAKPYKRVNIFDVDEDDEDEDEEDEDEDEEDEDEDDVDTDWIWEIGAKKQNFFAKIEDTIDAWDDSDYE